MKNKSRKLLVYITSSMVSVILIVTIVLLFILVPGRTMFPGVSNSFEKLMVVPNSPIEKDSSFNEETITGAGKYALDMDDGTKVGKITPTMIDNIVEYKRIINMAFEEGAEILVTSGFNLTDTLIGVTDYITGTIKPGGLMFEEKYKDKFFILIDDASYSASIARNIISVRFESAEVGFIAGIAASIYATWNGSYRVSTYGGMQYSTVFDFMSGYEQGINWFNYHYLGYDINHNLVETPLVSTEYQGDFVHLTNGINDVDYTNLATDSTKWFSGSFNIGEGTGITNKQIKEKSSVIFPVAGAQFGDSISSASAINDLNSTEYDYDIKIIGVDSDATKSYPKNEREILGSATKKVGYAAEFMLWYTDKFIGEYNQDPSLVPNTQLEQEFLNNVQQNSDDTTNPGWKESNTNYTNQDFSLATNPSEINIDSTSGKYYVDGMTQDDYFKYGKTLENGAMFVGNYNNGGVEFVETSPIDEYIVDIGITETFDEIVSIAFLENPIIENASNTFSDSYSTPRTNSSSTPWIPDWDGTYTKG